MGPNETITKKSSRGEVKEGGEIYDVSFGRTMFRKPSRVWANLERIVGEVISKGSPNGEKIACGPLRYFPGNKTSSYAQIVAS